MAHKLGRKALEGISEVFSPDTLLRWHRTLIARKYDGSKSRGMGRPQISDELRAAIIKIAKDNRGWAHWQSLAAVDFFTTEGYTLKAAGVKPIKSMPLAPNFSPFVERFIRSIKSEYLDRMIILSEAHLRYVISEYIQHYHTERARTKGWTIISLSHRRREPAT